MGKNIRPADLQKELQDILQNYEAEVNEAIEDALPVVGKETVKELKRTSPKDKGEYKKTWKSKIESDRLGKKLIVFNSKHYALTHLLEHGHAKVGGGRTQGNTKAIEHIKPAQDKAVEKVIKEIRRRLE